jgi:hypothetical protein
MQTMGMDAFEGDLETCVNKVKEVNEDEDKWLAMVNAPVLKHNKLEGSSFDIGLYAKKFRRALKGADSYLMRGAAN